MGYDQIPRSRGAGTPVLREPEAGSRRSRSDADYRKRRDRVLGLLQDASENGMVLEPRANAGLHASASLPDDIDEGALLADLAQRGFAIYGYDDFRHEPTGPSGVLFGFGAIDEDSLDEALPILADCLASAGSR